MQAAFLLILYGLFYAVITAFVNIGALDAMDLKQRHINDTQSFFREVNQIITADIIPREMAVPNFGTNIDNYLNYVKIRQKVNWSHNSDLTKDPWGTDFFGFVLTRRVPVVAQSGGGFLHIPVTAFVIVSAGPDKELSPELETALARLSRTSQIRDVTAVEAPLNSDDIVRTFTTYNAQMRHWQRIKSTLERVRVGISQIFKGQLTAFLDNLEVVYGDEYTDYINTVGQIIYTPEHQAQWANDGVTAALPDMLGLEKALDEFFYTEKLFIERNNLALRLKAFTTPGGPSDNSQCLGEPAGPEAHMMRMCLTNNGSPWGDSSGDLFYYIDIENIKIYE